MINNSLTTIGFPANRILVLEDDSGTAELVELVLEMSGYRSMVVATVPDITQLISEFAPDLILMDYLLPNANGGQLCKEVKSNPTTHHIPVIIYSAYPVASCLKSCEKHDAFISKPFDLDELSATIERLLVESKQLK